jgi:Fe-S cluster assembly protein SufD
VAITGLAAALRRIPDEVHASLGSQAKDDRSPFTSLGTAFLQDGAYVRLPPGTSLDLPVHLLFVSSRRASPFVSTPRVLIVAGAGSRVSIVETYAALAGNVYLTSAVSEVALGERAVVEHDKLQLESGAAYHVGATHVRLAAGSTFTSNAITFGGAIVRNNITARFDGEHAECTLNGLSVATGTQLVDNHTVIDHARAHCASHELYKAVLDGSSRGVFNGKIFVRKDAQKTDARQTNKTLLLSDEATIDTKPQLEIFADDVKCTHGATVGQLDEEQVFYLRSRGIGEVEARDLLTFAFASDVINRVHVGGLRARLDAMLHARLHDGRVAGED